MDPQRFIRHIETCTNAVLPGERVRLCVAGAEVGWVCPRDAPRAPLADAAAFDRHVDALRQQERFQPRGERFDVLDETSETLVATVDRGAVPLLGIVARGVHVNGLVRRPDGLHLWVGRRSADKRLDPRKLDHLTAGGIASGHDAWSTLVKEAEEEASLPATLARQAVPAGSVCYAMEREGGLRRDRLFCFDLYLPEAFVPRPNDGEVVDFALWPLADVVRRVADTDEFKFNVNLVLIDLSLRLGLIDPEGPVAEAMRPVRAGPIGPGQS